MSLIHCNYHQNYLAYDSYKLLLNSILNQNSYLVFHYLYHYQGSRSIYLMRRLPDRWELLRRCIALPLCGALAALLTGLLITLLWAGIYLLATPRELLSPLWYL